MGAGSPRGRGDVALIPSPTGTATGFGGDQRARPLGRVNREEGGDRGRWATRLGRPDDKGPGGQGGSFSFTSALFFLQKKCYAIFELPKGVLKNVGLGQINTLQYLAPSTKSLGGF